MDCSKPVTLGGTLGRKLEEKGFVLTKEQAINFLNSQTIIVFPRLNILYKTDWKLNPIVLSKETFDFSERVLQQSCWAVFGQ